MGPMSITRFSIHWISRRARDSIRGGRMLTCPSLATRSARTVQTLMVIPVDASIQKQLAGVRVGKSFG